LEKKGMGDNRPEGVVIRVLERANQQIVGTSEDNKAFGFLITDDVRIHNDVFIPIDHMNDAVAGHKVVVEFTKFTEGRKSSEGEVAKSLGHKNDPGIEILSIIYKRCIKIDFPDEVLQAVAEIPDHVTEKDKEGRRDLRDKTIVTIDGADAKDLDDAIRVEKLDNGNFLLGVYISDVSYYVTENSVIDQEALERGTSVYLVDRVIPM